METQWSSLELNFYVMHMARKATKVLNMEREARDMVERDRLIRDLLQDEVKVIQEGRGTQAPQSAELSKQGSLLRGKNIGF